MALYVYDAGNNAIVDWQRRYRDSLGTVSVKATLRAADKRAI